MHFQSTGDRFYLNGLAKISLKDVKMFKKWKDEYPHSTADYDSRFVSYLLTILFDRETLSRSSASGGVAHNVGTAHDPLDPERLNFLKSA